MRGLADVDLVQPGEPLPVVGVRGDHGQPLDAAPAPAAAADSERRRRPRRVRHQDARVAPRLGVDPDRPAGRRGTWRRWRPGRPGRPTTTMSSGPNRNRGRSARSTMPAPPVGRYRGGHRGERRHRRVPVLQVLDPPPAGAQVERGLAAGTVPGQQLVELGAPVHQHHPRARGSPRLPGVRPRRPGRRTPAAPAARSAGQARAPASRSAAGCPPGPSPPARAASTAEGPGSRDARRPRPPPSASPSARVPSARPRASARSLRPAPRPRSGSRPPRPRPARRALAPRCVDQLLLAAGELDLALQLVLGDRALPLDRHRAPFIGGPVGLLLDLLAGRGAQRLLHVRLRAQRDHPGADHRDPGLGQPRVGGEPARIRSRICATPSASALDSGLLATRPSTCCCAGLGQQPADLLQRRAAPPPGVRVDREVDPGGRRAPGR